MGRLAESVPLRLSTSFLVGAALLRRTDLKQCLRLLAGLLYQVDLSSDKVTTLLETLFFTLLVSCVGLGEGSTLFLLLCSFRL